MYQPWPRTSEARHGEVVSAIAGVATSPWIESLEWPLPFWLGNGLRAARIPENCELCEANDAPWILDLEDSYESVWKERFSTEVRRQIRRAKERGVEVIQRPTPGQVHQFSALWAAAYDSGKWGGYHFAERFFLAILRFLRSGARLLLAQIDGRVVAGGLFIDEGSGCVYHCGAMDRGYRSAFPMYAIIDSLVRDLCSSGKKYLNFGATGGINSLAYFKKEWGARPRPVYWLRCRKTGPRLTGPLRIANGVLRRLMVLLFRLIRLTFRRQVLREAAKMPWGVHVEC